MALGLVVGPFIVVTLLTAIVLTVLFLVFMPNFAGAAGVALLRTTPLLARVCGVTVLLVPGLELALRPAVSAWPAGYLRQSEGLRSLAALRRSPFTHPHRRPRRHR